MKNTWKERLLLLIMTILLFMLAFTLPVGLNYVSLFFAGVVYGLFIGDDLKND